MFKFNIKLLYFLGSNVVVNNIYCTNTVKKNTFTLHLPTDKDYYLYMNNKSNTFNTDKDTFEDVLKEMKLTNFKSFTKKNFFKQKNGALLFKIEDITIHKVSFDKKSKIDFDHQYHLYFTDNYIDSTDDSIIKIQNNDNSDYTEYKKNYRLFIDRFKDINQESLLIGYIYGLNDEIQKNFYFSNSFSSDYYIKSFKIGDNIIIDDEKPFTKDALKIITKKDHAGKQIEIILNKYKSYKLIGVNITLGLAKIYKLKDTNDLINEINSEIAKKSKKELTYGDIQKFITENCALDGMFLNNNSIDKIPQSFNITIKEDNKKYYLEPKKCTIAFVSDEFELENTYKNPFGITFDNEINEDVKIEEYIFKKYELDNEKCRIERRGTLKPIVIDTDTFSDNANYTIVILKEVDKITKKKDADKVIINIEIVTDKSTEFKLKDNVVKNTQIVLKKGSCKINDLLTKLNENGYNGIEQDGIIKEIFLTAKPSNNILTSNDDITAGQYKILLSGQENNFVEKKIKKPTKKNITLTIVPKDKAKYELKGISSNITINVPENISYIDFVKEIKNTITDGKFEIYVDNNNVKNGNIDINKPIIIKLLDDCDKLKKIKNDDDDGNVGGNGNGNVGGDENDKNDTKSTQKCQCRSSKR